MKFLKNRCAKVEIIDMVIGIVVAVIMIPVAIIQINESAGNFTGVQRTLLNLVPTLLIVGLLATAYVSRRKK